MKERAKVVGTITPIRRLPDYMKPCKVQFGAMLRKALSAKRIPVNNAGRLSDQTTYAGR